MLNKTKLMKNSGQDSSWKRSWKAEDDFLRVSFKNITWPLLKTGLFSKKILKLISLFIFQQLFMKTYLIVILIFPSKHIQGKFLETAIFIYLRSLCKIKNHLQSCWVWLNFQRDSTESYRDNLTAMISASFV